MFDPSSSNTSSRQDGSFNISYADGSSAYGSIYTDTVTVAGVSVSNQTFSVVTTVTFNDGLPTVSGWASSSLLFRSSPDHNALELWV